jgi:hypothetical protein
MAHSAVDRTGVFPLCDRPAAVDGVSLLRASSTLRRQPLAARVGRLRHRSRVCARRDRACRRAEVAVRRGPLRSPEPCSLRATSCRPLPTRRSSSFRLRRCASGWRPISRTQSRSRARSFRRQGSRLKGTGSSHRPKERTRSDGQPAEAAFAQSSSLPESWAAAGPTSTMASTGAFARRAAATIASGDGAS